VNNLISLRYKFSLMSTGLVRRSPRDLRGLLPPPSCPVLRASQGHPLPSSAGRKDCAHGRPLTAPGAAGSNRYLSKVLGDMPGVSVAFASPRANDGALLAESYSNRNVCGPSSGIFLPRTSFPFGASVLGTSGGEICCQTSGPLSGQVSQPGNPGFLGAEGSATKTKEQSEVGQE